jgi:hypothetical protein
MYSERRFHRAESFPPGLEAAAERRVGGASRGTKGAGVVIALYAL